MNDATQNNALAEVAFALAMAFFALLVVSLVGISASSTAPALSPEITFQSAPLSLAKSSKDSSSPPTNGVHAIRHEQLVLYVNGHYYDADLTAIDLASISHDTDLILGVPPTLSMAETMQAQEQLAWPNIQVMPLNQQWLETLKQAGL